MSRSFLEQFQDDEEIEDYPVHQLESIDVIEEKYLQFESLIPYDLIIYGQDYLANDLQHRIQNKNIETHPRFNTVWKNL